MSDSQAIALLANPSKVEIKQETNDQVPAVPSTEPKIEEQVSTPPTLKPKSNAILDLLDETTVGTPVKKNETNNETKTVPGSSTLDLSDIEMKNDAPEPAPQLTMEQIREKKERILYDIERLRRRGVRFPRSFTMASDLEEMESEYNRIKKDLETEQGIRFQRKMLMTCVSGIEMLNSRFDPFDVQLDGWSESVNENIGDYDDVFEELYEKYRGSGKMAPELRLLFMLGGSALMFHMTKSMFSSASPQISEVFKQNPNMVAQMMGQMGQQSGGAGGGGGGGGGFMNLMGMAQSGVQSSPTAPPPAPPRGVAVPPPENVDDVLNDLQRPSASSKRRSGKSGSRGRGKSAAIDTISLSLQN